MEKGSLNNAALYEQLSLDLSLDPAYSESRAPVGRAQKQRNLYQRAVRWHQQTLKRMGVLERMERGQWRMTDKARKELTPAAPKRVLLAFSTDLGCALWGNAEDVFTRLDEDIALCFTSPPYPLAKQRAYGNVTQQAYVDWLVTMMEPIVRRLLPGGNIVLNLSNDIFEPGLPSRSLYLERVTLALHDRLGLHLMERFVWHNPSKPPGPVQWASLKRVQCNVAYEPILWFTNDPKRVIADNRRVLLPHTERHQKLLENGGEAREAVYAGGAYRLRDGSFGQKTEGRIPRNVLMVGHRDTDQEPARRYAKEHGLPAHPAPMPLRVAELIVEFLSEVGQLVVDPFGGSGTTGRAAENKQRRWLISERCREYLASGAERFRKCSGFECA